MWSIMEVYSGVYPYGHNNTCWLFRLRNNLEWRMARANKSETSQHDQKHAVRADMVKTPTRTRLRLSILFGNMNFGITEKWPSVMTAA